MKNKLPIIIGLGALALGFVFRKKIAQLFTPQTNLPILPNDENINMVSIPVPKDNKPNKVEKILSPIGTTKDNLNFSIPLSINDKGAEVLKLQQILNRISVLNNSQKITEDGKFGIGTQTKLSKIFGKSLITLRNAYTMLFAIYAAKRNKEQKNWFDKYYQMYLIQPERLKNARKLYFDNNSSI